MCEPKEYLNSDASKQTKVSLLTCVGEVKLLYITNLWVQKQRDRVWWTESNW